MCTVRNIFFFVSAHSMRYQRQDDNDRCLARVFGVIVACGVAIALIAAVQSPQTPAAALSKSSWTQIDRPNVTEDVDEAAPLANATAASFIEANSTDSLPNSTDPFPTSTSPDFSPAVRNVALADVNHEHEDAPVFEGDNTTPRACPLGKSAIKKKKSADGKKLNLAVSKYTGYAAQYCNATGMMQMHVTFADMKHIIRRIAAMMNIQRGDKILDFGSGCGTMLNYLHLALGTEGTGVDLTSSAVFYARAHAQPRQLFCHSEGGSFLRFVQPNTFNHVIAWSSVHHIRRKMVQCEVVNQMLRVVKPGGSVLVAHMHGDHTIAYWRGRKCSVGNATFKVFADFRAYGIEAFKRNRYPSVLLRKML
jgi:ubiquinone/menaquinone biosynthesis C-methylase UbiE